MRILNYYGNGRTSTLKSIVAAMRAVRRGKLHRLQVGPLDETLLASLGLIVTGPDEDMDAFLPLMEAEAKRMKIEVEPSEFIGEIN